MLASISHRALSKYVFFVLIAGFQMVGHGFSFAQSYNYRFHNLSIDDGLSTSGTTKVLQDSLGFIWIATEEGLNRYDGYSFKIYKHSPFDSTSIPADEIHDMSFDNDGNIWLATAHNGIIKFDPRTENFEHFTAPSLDGAVDQAALPENTTTAIFIDRDETVWIGTRYSGLVRYNPITQKFKTFQNDTEVSTSVSSNRIFNIIAADNEKLWISTSRGGLNLFNKKTEEFTHFKHDPEKNSIPTNTLRNIYLAKNGMLWIGSSGGGLTRYDPKTNEYRIFQNDPNNKSSLPYNEAYSIGEDRDGRIWVGTWSRGLAIYDPETDSFRNYRHNPSNPNSIPGDIITHFFQDNLGQMWMGSSSSGLAYFDPKEQSFTRYQHSSINNNSLTGSKIRSVLEDSHGQLWIGTIAAGLNRYDREKDEFSVYINDPNDPNSLANNTAWCLFEDADGTLWIGTSRGVHRYNRESDSFTRYQPDPNNVNSLSGNNVMNIKGDSQGNIWAGTWGQGLNKFNPKTGRWDRIEYNPTYSDELINHNVKQLLVDKDDNLWVGTTNGVARLDIAGNHWIHYLHNPNTPSSISSSNIMALFESKDGRIWIGTDQGLNIFDKESGTFKKLSVVDGLSNRNILGIAEDKDGRMWVSTAKGLNKYDPQSDTVTVYYKGDGLQSDEFNQWAYSQSKTGRIYFGGINGLNEFTPESLINKSNSPKISLTEFLIFNKPVAVNKESSLSQSLAYNSEISIDYSDYIFALEFSALHYRQAQKCQYAYILEGFDNDWINTSWNDRKAVYTNVPPGEYTFKVKATDDNGVWSEESASIRIRIIPPWWKTWWAKTLLYTLLGIILLSVYLIRISVIKKQKKRLEQQVKEKTIEISNQNIQLQDHQNELESLNSTKDRLLSLVSHDVRTPLNSLQGIFTLFENKNISPKELTDMVPMVGKQLQQINTFLENLLRWAKNQLQGTILNKQEVKLKSVANACINLLETASAHKKLHIDLNILENTMVFTDEDMVKFILRNFMSNAIKFCDTGDQIKISSSLDNQFAIVSVEDTGTGISQDQLKNIFSTNHLSLKGTSNEMGTGLGLSLCKEYAELIGGNIGVESTVGQGSRFWFTIPITEG